MWVKRIKGAVKRNALASPQAYLFLMLTRCARADPAALLEAALVRPSRKTADALVATFDEVTLGGATWDNVLPAADFDAFPVPLLERTEEEFFAALLLVIFVAIQYSLRTTNHSSTNINPSSTPRPSDTP